MTEANNLEEYIRDLKKRVQDNPEDGVAHYNLACVLIGEGRHQDAEEELKKAIQLTPDLAEAYVQLGGLAMNKGDLLTCLSYNQKAAEFRPRFAVPHGNIGFVHLQLGKPDEAVKALRRALS